MTAGGSGSRSLSAVTAGARRSQALACAGAATVIDGRNTAPADAYHLDRAGGQLPIGANRRGDAGEGFGQVDDPACSWVGSVASATGS